MWAAEAREGLDDEDAVMGVGRAGERLPAEGLEHRQRQQRDGRGVVVPVGGAAGGGSLDKGRQSQQRSARIVRQDLGAGRRWARRASVASEWRARCGT